jgi:hypothetical protein
MDTEPFQIGAQGVDVETIVRDIRATVEAKMRAGAYADARIARAERTNLRNLPQGENFLEFYLDCLREAVFVDISDFEIYERRRALAPALVALKRTIWKLLRFYTYRLWSQQNQVNGLLLTATEEIDRKYQERIRALEERIARLEAERPPAVPPSAP